MKSGLIKKAAIKTQIILLIALPLAACSSYKNLNDGKASAMGGGFKDEKIDDGVYRVTARTNFAPWTNHAGAYKTLNRRAQELCQGEFTVVNSSESSFEHTQTAGELKYIISQVVGLIHCKTSPLQPEEVEQKYNNWEFL